LLGLDARLSGQSLPKGYSECGDKPFGSINERYSYIIRGSIILLIELVEYYKFAPLHWREER
jgi:hypothetical protein